MSRSLRTGGAVDGRRLPIEERQEGLLGVFKQELLGNGLVGGGMGPGSGMGSDRAKGREVRPNEGGCQHRENKTAYQSVLEGKNDILSDNNRHCWNKSLYPSISQLGLIPTCPPTCISTHPIVVHQGCMRLPRTIFSERNSCIYGRAHQATCHF